MGLIDSHAHLTFDAFADVDAVLDRAAEAGVQRVISIGTDIRDAERVIALAQRHHAVEAAMGIHPHEAGRLVDGDWDRYRTLMRADTVVALGEMGLDYHYDFADRNAQRDVFERQLALAAEVDKPIIIHCREAHDDTVAILNSAGFGGRRVVFHCFTGTAAERAQIADNGWRVSFTGIVTFKSAGELARIAADYPADQLMVETDSPYLSPVPVRHVRPNEPAHVAHVARFLADRRGQPFEEFSEQTRANTVAFFGLKPI